MKKQIVNPYLPLDVCQPDGEPHVFNGRLYLFGSHDTLGGNRFCRENYEFYSAPLEDLTDWSSPGISYDKSLDPDVCETGKYPDLYAPDVVQGNDGRYYLYYAPSGGNANGFSHAFTDHIHVAVSQAPDGPYHYYGCVRNLDGTPFQRGLAFDPSLINDEGTIRMYYGWGFLFPAVCKKGPLFRLQSAIMDRVSSHMFDLSAQQKQEGYLGAYTVTLADDMLTVTSEPVKILPGQKESFGTQWEGHLCHALSDGGAHEAATMLFMREDLPSWLYAVNKGATTLWEKWDAILPDGTMQDPGLNSMNHYANGAIGDWMYRKIGGINETEAGYRRFVIRPRFVRGIEEVDCQLETPYGRIVSRWACRGGVIRVEVTVPANTRAVLYLPEKSDKEAIELGSGTYLYEYPTSTDLRRLRFTLDSTLGDIMAQPLGLQLLTQYAPELVNNPMIEYAKRMTLAEGISSAPQIRPLYEMVLGALNAHPAPEN